MTKVVAVQCAAKVVVEQELPAYWQTESIKSIILDEVVHLADSSALLDDVVRLVRSGQGTLSVNGASKVESGDVDTFKSGTALAVYLTQVVIGQVPAYCTLDARGVSWVGAAATREAPVKMLNSVVLMMAVAV